MKEIEALLFAISTVGSFCTGTFWLLAWASLPDYEWLQLDDTEIRRDVFISSVSFAACTICGLIFLFIHYYL